jgi:DNA topoisomerase IB
LEPVLSDIQLIEWVNMVNVPPELTAEVYLAQ